MRQKLVECENQFEPELNLVTVTSVNAFVGSGGGGSGHANDSFNEFMAANSIGNRHHKSGGNAGGGTKLSTILADG